MAIGIAGSSLATISFLPQVVKSWKTRKTEDISFAMYTLYTLGIILWVIYGFLRWDIPILLGNSITLFLCGSILYLKLKNKGN
ncbi:MAG: SemiSWEET transporter [bacterium]|nr:SemiSWEET transporter [bacterium]